MDVWEIVQRHENYFENSIVSSPYEKNNEMKNVLTHLGYIILCYE